MSSVYKRKKTWQQEYLLFGLKLSVSYNTFIAIFLSKTILNSLLIHILFWAYTRRYVLFEEVDKKYLEHCSATKIISVLKSDLLFAYLFQ